MANVDLDVKNSLDSFETLKEVFAAVAHQWRGPLSQINSIVGSIDNRLYEQNIDDPVLQKQLLQIEAITKEMSQTIDDYRGYFEKKNEMHSLKELVNQALKHELDLLAEDGIRVDIEIEEHIEFIGDELLLKQIIATLLENAKDAHLERNVYKPFIVMSAKSDDDFLFMKICDNAGGISKSVMQKIFEPSFTTKHSSEGTGLGLFMVKKLLDEKLQATIDVKNVESGSCFTLQIPKMKEDIK